MRVDQSSERRALEVEHELAQLAHKLHAAERHRQSAILLAHKLGWIAVAQAVAILALAYQFATGGPS